MSTAKETASAGQNEANNHGPQELKVSVVGNAKDAGGVLQRLQARLIRPVNYSIVPGELSGTMEITLSVPGRDPRVEHGNQITDPAQLLAQVHSILTVQRVETSMRRHIRLVTDMGHPDAAAFTNVIEQLGGHAQGKKGTLKITAGRPVLDGVMACARGMNGLVRQGRVNSPFTTVQQDVPHAAEIDVTGSPDYAPDVERHILRIHTIPGLHHDVEIIEILQRNGFHVSSVGSRAPESDPDMQELTIKLQDGNDAMLQRALPDITILIGVRNVQRLDQRQAVQYVQAVFPLGRLNDMRRLLRENGHLHNRGRMTPDMQVVVSGSMPLAGAATLQRELAQSSIGRRPNPAINQDLGTLIRGVESRWPRDDAGFYAEYRASMLEALQSLVQVDAEV